MVFTGWSIASGVPPLAVPVRIVVTEFNGDEQTLTFLDYTETYRRARKCVKMHGRSMGKYGAQGASSYSGLFIRLIPIP